MTYRELLEKLEDLRPELLDTDVTVFIDDEFRHVYVLDFTTEDDVLDAGHPFLM